MKKYIALIISFHLCIFVSLAQTGQSDIKLEDLINSVNWDNCTESDIIYLYKDNIVQGEKDVTIDEYTSSKYDIKGVQIGKYHSSWGHIDVHKYTRKLKKIVLVIDVSEEDKKNPELFQSSLEAYLKTFLGDKYHKIIEFGWSNDIECVWDDNYNIGCGVKTWVVPGSKTAGITIGKGIKYKGIE